MRDSFASQRPGAVLVKTTNGYVREGGHNDDVSVIVTIGRNVGREPMSDLRWNLFQGNVVRAMVDSYPDDRLYDVELHTGFGVWDLKDEESAIFSMRLPRSEFRVDHLRAFLSDVASQYGQDAIALQVGPSELIAARTD